MSNKMLLFSVVLACNPVDRMPTVYCVGGDVNLNHAQSKRARN